MTIDIGDIVETTTDLTESFHLIREGTRFRVQDIDEGFRPGDPEYGDEKFLQGRIIDGWANHGDVQVQESDLRLVAKAKDVDPPTKARVVAALTMDDMAESWFCHEETTDGAAKTFQFLDEETGLEWTAEVRVTYLEEADL